MRAEGAAVAEITAALEYEFVRNALVAGFLASLLCGVIGSFVVIKRLVFVSGGISHAAFGGMGIAFFLGLPATLGAIAAATASALLLGTLGGERFRSHDALIGVLWSVGMAIGIVFLQLTPGYAPDLMAYLFGDILSVTSRDLAIALALNALVLGAVAAFWKELVAVSFDESFAAVQGVRVRWVSTGLMLLIALSVVLLIQVVGIVLVIALLSIPPLVGLRLTRSLQGLLTCSIATGLAMTMLGLVVSYRYDLPSGPTIILVGAAGLLGVSLVAGRRPRRTLA